MHIIIRYLEFPNLEVWLQASVHHGYREDIRILENITTHRAQATLLPCSSVTGSDPALGAVEVEVITTTAPATANN
jgi:hypothetical protein